MDLMSLLGSQGGMSGDPSSMGGDVQAPMGGRQLPLGVDPQAGDKKLNVILQLLVAMLARGQAPQMPQQAQAQMMPQQAQALPAPQPAMQGTPTPQSPFGG
jgi:hypothetical protein